MIWLNPQHVTLGGVQLDEVRHVAVEEKSDALLVEFNQAGPHAAFVDVPERRTIVKVRRRVLGNENLGLSVGSLMTLVMRTAPSGSDGSAGVELTASVVLTSVSYKVDRRDGAEQVIEGVAQSVDGATPPVSVTVDGGA